MNKRTDCPETATNEEGADSELIFFGGCVGILGERITAERETG